MRFLWVWPLTAEEARLKHERGADALVDLMLEDPDWPITNPARGSLVDAEHG